MKPSITPTYTWVPTWTYFENETAVGTLVLVGMDTLVSGIATEKVRLGTGTETMTVVPGQLTSVLWTPVGMINGNWCKPGIMVVGTGKFQNPVKGERISGNVFSIKDVHLGVDLGANLGDEVYAVDKGSVIYSGWLEGGWGELIVINHGDGWKSWYVHLSKLNVICGQEVSQGQVIGLVGMTGGTSNGPHLHFELWNVKLGYVDPLKYLVVVR
jgi:murein DD-endopeptidase MepM/ murein hydrolase activator NlpD